MDRDKHYMKSALKLAEGASNRTGSNPRVGCIVVKNNRIVGRGCHEYFSGPHAEVNALSAAGNRANGATMYVTLEPCCHYGKTPPCTDAIIKAGIRRVVVSMKDPNLLMMGRSISLLRKRGVKVETGLLAKEAEKINEAYIKYIRKGLPFVILKSAMTLDGKIASASGDSKWITCRRSRDYVHEVRSKVDAVLVGINTIIADDPELTSRKKGMNPVRIVLDTHLKISMDAEVLDNKVPTIIATCSANKSKIKKLDKMGVQVINPGKTKDGINLQKLLKKLGGMAITSLLVEGGGRVNASFISQGLVDKVMFFIAPKIIGGRDSITPVEGRGIMSISNAIGLSDITVRRFDDDILVEGYIKY